MATMAEDVPTATESKPEAIEGDQDDVLSKVRTAVFARAKDILKNVETWTMGKIRRELERDLGMGICTLDSHKKKISALVDQVLSMKNQDDANGETETDGVAADLSLDQGETDEKSGKATKSKVEVSDDDSDKTDIKKVSRRKPAKVNKLTNTRKAKPDVTDESERESSDEEDVRAAKTKSNKRSRKMVVVSDESEEDDTNEEAQEVDDSESPSKNIDSSHEKKSPEIKSPGKSPRKNPQKGPVKSLRKILEESPDKSSQKSKSPVSNDMEEDEDVKKDSKQKTTTTSKKSSGKKAAKTDPKTLKRKFSGDPSDEEATEEASADEKKPKKASKAPEKSQNQLAEKLKRMIKSSGMSVSPSMYKRVNQAPESKRDNALIKELEAILQKEGLNRHSSEKELKAVRRKKDKQQDLEGIDPGNIINDGRPRRQQTNFYDFPEVPAERRPKRRKAVVVSSDEDEDEEVEKKGKSDVTQEKEVDS